MVYFSSSWFLYNWNRPSSVCLRRDATLQPLLLCSKLGACGIWRGISINRIKVSVFSEEELINIPAFEGTAKYMENNTISYLHSKTWYRTLKVVFIAIFFVAFLATNLSILNGTWGNNYVFLGFPLSSVEFPTPLNGIQLLIINNLLVFLIFEIIRRSFYYIILGSLKPSKN
jgi:hypothetical protein